MDLKKLVLCMALIMVGLLFLATAVFSGAPYRWPQDTGGDPSAHGEGANGWDYFVDYHDSEHGDSIASMIWCPGCGRWEDPMFAEMPEGATIEKDVKGWKIIGGGFPGMAINPKVALHPSITEDLDGAEKKNFKLGIDMRALPGGASLRIFICDSNPDTGIPDPASNRRDLFGTKDNPIMYGPNEPITGTWPVSVGEEGSGADMTDCDWIVFEVDDPNVTDGDEGGGEGDADDVADDDSIDDDSADDSVDDDVDDDDDITWFREDHCPLLSEIVATPAGGQFIEILNPTDERLDLSDVYLSNSPLYYGVVKQDSSVDDKSGAGGYFNAKFPAGTTLGADEFIVVAVGDGTGFSAQYGTDPNFILFSAKAAVNMQEAFYGSISGQGDLSKAGEAVMLYKWNGRSDLVCDCDYAVFGDKSSVVDKTGVEIDGIDPDAVETAYNDDTPPAGQKLVAAAAHADGESFNRCDKTEGQEEKSGDNNGCDPDSHDETSEDLDVTWKTLTPPTPGEEADCVGGDDDVDDADDDDDDDADDTVDDDAGDDDDDDGGCCG